MLWAEHSLDLALNETIRSSRKVHTVWEGSADGRKGWKRIAASEVLTCCQPHNQHVYSHTQVRQRITHSLARSAAPLPLYEGTDAITVGGPLQKSLCCGFLCGAAYSALDLPSPSCCLCLAGGW